VFLLSSSILVVDDALFLGGVAPSYRRDIIILCSPDEWYTYSV
jgi:hypothetical protein